MEQEDRGKVIHIAEPGPYAIRTGFPMDLADEGQASEVKASFDPSLFEWEHEDKPKEYFITIRARTLYVSKDIRMKLKDIAQQKGLLLGDDYWVQIGLTKKAIAIKLSEQMEQGYKLRPIKASSSSGQISCISVIRKLNEICNVSKLEAIWDDKSKMFVARFGG